MRKTKWDNPASQSIGGYGPILSPNPMVPLSIEDDIVGGSRSLEAASAAAAKINAMLMAKGKLHLPGQNKIIKEIDKKDKAKTDLVVAEIEINDVPMGCRNMLTKGSTQDEISKATGAAVSTRGRFMSYSDRASNNMGERPLYLCVQGQTKECVDKAIERITDIINKGMIKTSGNTRWGNSFTPVINWVRMPEAPAPAIRPPLPAIPTRFPPPQPAAQPVLPTGQFFQEKVFVGLEHAHASFSVKEKIQGPGNSFLNHIRSETGATAYLRGKGSGFMEPTSGREAFENLYIYITHPRQEGLQAAKKLCENLVQTIHAEYTNFQGQMLTSGAISGGGMTQAQFIRSPAPSVPLLQTGPPPSVPVLIRQPQPPMQVVVQSPAMAVQQGAVSRYSQAPPVAVVQSSLVTGMPAVPRSVTPLSAAVAYPHLQRRETVPGQPAGTTVTISQLGGQQRLQFQGQPVIASQAATQNEMSSIAVRPHMPPGHAPAHMQMQSQQQQQQFVHVQQAHQALQQQQAELQQEAAKQHAAQQVAAVQQAAAQHAAAQQAAVQQVAAAHRVVTAQHVAVAQAAVQQQAVAQQEAVAQQQAAQQHAAANQQAAAHHQHAAGHHQQTAAHQQVASQHQVAAQQQVTAVQQAQAQAVQQRNLHTQLQSHHLQQQQLVQQQSQQQVIQGQLLQQQPLIQQIVQAQTQQQHQAIQQAQLQQAQLQQQQAQLQQQHAHLQQQHAARQAELQQAAHVQPMQEQQHVSHEQQLQHLQQAQQVHLQHVVQQTQLGQVQPVASSYGEIQTGLQQVAQAVASVSAASTIQVPLQALEAQKLKHLQVIPSTAAVLTSGGAAVQINSALLAQTQSAPVSMATTSLETAASLYHQSQPITTSIQTLEAAPPTASMAQSTSISDIVSRFQGAHANQQQTSTHVVIHPGQLTNQVVVSSAGMIPHLFARAEGVHRIEPIETNLQQELLGREEVDAEQPKRRFREDFELDGDLRRSRDYEHRSAFDRAELERRRDREDDFQMDRGDRRRRSRFEEEESSRIDFLERKMDRNRPYLEGERERRERFERDTFQSEYQRDRNRRESRFSDREDERRLLPPPIAGLKPLMGEQSLMPPPKLPGVFRSGRASPPEKGVVQANPSRGLVAYEGDSDSDEESGPSQHHLKRSGPSRFDQPRRQALRNSPPSRLQPPNFNAPPPSDRPPGHRPPGRSPPGFQRPSGLLHHSAAASFPSPPSSRGNTSGQQRSSSPPLGNVPFWMARH